MGLHATDPSGFKPFPFANKLTAHQNIFLFDYSTATLATSLLNAAFMTPFFGI